MSKGVVMVDWMHIGQEGLKYMGGGAGALFVKWLWDKYEHRGRVRYLVRDVSFTKGKDQSLVPCPEVTLKLQVRNLARSTKYVGIESFKFFLEHGTELDAFETGFEAEIGADRRQDSIELAGMSPREVALRASLGGLQSRDAYERCSKIRVVLVEFPKKRTVLRFDGETLRAQAVERDRAAAKNLAEARRYLFGDAADALEHSVQSGKTSDNRR